MIAVYVAGILGAFFFGWALGREHGYVRRVLEEAKDQVEAYERSKLKGAPRT